MGASAGSIFVDLILRDAKYAQGLGKASQATKKFTNEASGALSGLAKGFAGAFTVGAFVSITKAAIDSASNLKDLSESLGLTTDELQKYTYAAKLAGVDSDKLQTAFTKLNSQIAAGELPYKTTGDAIQDISDRVKNATTNIERAAIVNEAFGAKLGAKLIPFLSSGSEGLKLLGEEAERLGIVINGGTIEATEKFGDQLDIRERD